ncbi:prolipoprotein diacylglyceryl transferase [Candidatus Woesearchaeota archaeon]|nr:prolipoprotein diacylglyceryl transferase [Candidatus Woesearchaeota archaeon]
MFIHNINPVLLAIGPLQVRYYGLVYAIGFIAAYILLLNLAKKGTVKNLNTRTVDVFIIYLIIGAIIGARVLLFVFYYPSTLLSDPLEVFRIWNGGMSFHGGLLGAVAASATFCKKYKVSFYKLADFLVLPLSLALFFGRIANFINGELVGTVTTPEKTPWCVVFKDYEGCRHPSQLYEAAKNLIIFSTLLVMYTNKDIKKKLKDGMIFWGFVLMYGILRFIITFWRDDPAYLLGFSGGQLLCMAMVAVAAFFIIKIAKNKKGKGNKHTGI